MARKEIVVLSDDIDGSEASQTVAFALDGVTYEIDLNDEHAAALRESFEEWTSRARRVGGRRSVRGAAVSRNSNTKVIREWLRGEGVEISDRGRIPNELVQRYNEAHGL